MSDPLVCVIVLNRDGRKHLEYCLPSILATDYSNWRLIVVDNASSDDSLECLRQNFPQVEVIRSERNLGWSGGNNLGLTRAAELAADYVILNNNDVRVDPRWITQAVAAARQDARIGAVCWTILEPRGGPYDAGFTPACAAWTTLQVSDAARMDGILLLPRQLLDDLGRIDEGFFVYGEDNDLEYRLRAAGYRIVRINLPMWHHGSAYLSRIPLRAGGFQMRSDLRLAIKYRSLAGVAYEWLRHLAIACLPFLKTDPHDGVKRRLRPANIFVNFFIFMGASLWNIGRLPQTLRRRREDLQRIQAVRRTARPA